MSRLTIPPHDRHGIYLFSAALGPEEMQRDKARLATGLLGDPDLDPAHLELFDLADLAGVGLPTYLVEGLGISEAAVAPDRARLEALTGPVLILRSKALHGRGVTLTPDPRLTLLGSYREESPPVHFTPLPTAAAQGTLTAPPPAPGPHRLPGAFVLLLLALALTGAVALWLAFG
ncbi:MAG: hypothetical protein ACLGIE_09155 [Alphaproteobacteria bacterium]